MDLSQNNQAGAAFGANLLKTPELCDLIPAPRGSYGLTCIGPGGEVKWKEEVKNLVTTLGLNHIVDVVFNGGTQIATWYLALISGTPTVAAGDTLASAAWTEVTAYSQATRPVWTPGAVSGGSIDNSGSVASFSINANGTTIGGAGLCEDNTKGGTTGLLYSVGPFTGGDKSADDGDTLQVTATLSAADDGV